MPTPEKLATDATVAIMLADGFEEVEAPGRSPTSCTAPGCAPT